MSDRAAPSARRMTSQERRSQLTEAAVDVAAAGGFQALTLDAVAERAGVTRNPVRLTRSVQALKTTVTCGGAPTYVWPGGGITLMADVTKMPDGSFGYVPTPAIVAPLEFTLRREDYRALGGHDDRVRRIDDILEHGGEYGADARAVAPARGRD